MLSSTIAGGFAIREAGASELSPEAAAMKNVTSTVAGLGLAADPAAVAAATDDRAGVAASRDTARQALAVLSTATAAADASAAKAKAAAAAKAEAAAEAKAAKAKAAKAKADAIAAAHRWVKPLASYTLTSGYGWRWGKMHPAQDLATPVGSKVHALSSGTVVFAGWDTTGYGNLVRIQYWDGTTSWMAHNSRLVVSVGDQVEPGQLVAYSGNTGNSTGPHVHLEIHPADGAPVSPMPWLSRHGINL